MKHLFIKVIPGLLLYMVISISLCGYGSRVYASDSSNTSQIIGIYEEQAGKRDTSISFLSLPEIWYNGSIYIKRWAPVVIVGSFLTGWVIYDVFKKVKEVQKWAFYLLMIKIPVFTFIFVYVYSFLYRMLNL